MMVDRRTVTVSRSAVVGVFIGAGIVVGVLVMVGVAMVRQAEQAKVLAADVAEISADAKAAAEANRAILEAQQLRDTERQPLVDAAIARIIGDNAEAHAALLGEIARLVNRPVPAAAIRPIPRPTSPTSATAPRAGASTPAQPPAAPPSTAAPKPQPVGPTATTTTTRCETRGKKGKCVR